MDKADVKIIKELLKQKFVSFKHLISNTFIDALLIIAERQAKLEVEELINLIKNSYNNTIVFNLPRIKASITFLDKLIVVDNACTVSSVTTLGGEPINIVCNIPEYFNGDFAYKNEESVFEMPCSLKNSTKIDCILNANGISSICRAIGIDTKEVSEKQIRRLLICLRSGRRGNIILGNRTFTVDNGSLITDFCTISYCFVRGLVIDYDDGKTKTLKTYTVDANGNVLYKKEEYNFYKMTQLEAIDYRLKNIENADIERLSLLKEKFVSRLV